MDEIRNTVETTNDGIRRFYETFEVVEYEPPPIQFTIDEWLALCGLVRVAGSFGVSAEEAVERLKGDAS